jgi:hypothetical protein
MSCDKRTGRVGRERELVSCTGIKEVGADTGSNGGRKDQIFELARIEGGLFATRLRSSRHFPVVLSVQRSHQL